MSGDLLELIDELWALIGQQKHEEEIATIGEMDPEFLFEIPPFLTYGYNDVDMGPNTNPQSGLQMPQDKPSASGGPSTSGGPTTSSAPSTSGGLSTSGGPSTSFEQLSSIGAGTAESGRYTTSDGPTTLDNQLNSIGAGTAESNTLSLSKCINHNSSEQKEEPVPSPVVKIIDGSMSENSENSGNEGNKESSQKEQTAEISQDEGMKQTPGS